MTENFRISSHCRFSLKYHFVWVTKYRKPILRGEVGYRLRTLIRELCLQLEVEILEGAVRPEHVHLLVSCPPKLSPSKLIQLLKGRTSRKLMLEFRHLKKMYWGRHLWARGYFVASSGTVTDEIIAEYIREQDNERPLENGDDHFSVS